MSRLGFGGSLCDSQADKARQTGQAEPDASYDGHADQSI